MLYSEVQISRDAQAYSRQSWTDIIGLCCWWNISCNIFHQAGTIVSNASNFILSILHVCEFSNINTEDRLKVESCARSPLDEKVKGPWLVLWYLWRGRGHL